MYFFKILPDHCLIPHLGGPVKGGSLNLIRQILLLYVMVGIIVGVLITGAPSQIGGPLIVGVSQMGRNCGFYIPH